MENNKKNQTSTNTKRNPPIPANELGKLPPQAPELEEMILGAVMIEKDAIETIDLVPSDFYKVSHQKIFQAVMNLKDRHNPIDMFTVTDELRKMNAIDDIGGPYFITQLVSKLSSAAHLQYHALIVKQKSVARQLIEQSSIVLSMAFNESTDVQDIFEYIETSFTEISTGSVEADSCDMEESISQMLEHISLIQKNAMNHISTAIPTGIHELDKRLNGGWNAPDLVIMGGRPSMGKTQFAVHFAKHAGLTDNDCLFISIEMTKIQLLIRMITEDEGIPFYKIKTGQLNPEEWNLINIRIAEMLKLKINIADDHKIRYLGNIKSLARKQKRKGQLKMMIIDYLGLIRTNQKFQNRDLEIGYITSELKNLAKELNIPIILLAQLSRPQKGMKVERPKLEDLRESGNIEQDADIVIFPHRPSYYDATAQDSDGFSWKNRGVLFLSKHREGEKDAKVYFNHDDNFKKIWDSGQLLEDNPF